MPLSAAPMTMRRALLPALLIWQVAAAPADDRRSSEELKRLPARQADTVARRDLLSILRPVAPPRTGMYRRLHGVSFATREYGTEYAGLCGRDEVTLWYGAPGPHANDPAAPLTPYALTTSAFFHADGDVRPDRSGSAGRPEAAAGCARAGMDRLGWFAAPTAGTAFAGRRALAAALEAVQLGAVIPDCGGTTACAARITADDRLHSLTAIATCDAAVDRPCYRLTFSDDVELRIVTDFSRALDPLAVQSIRYGEFVIVT